MFGRYFSFSGRATRAEFWMVGLITSVLLTVLIMSVVAMAASSMNSSADIGAQIRSLAGPATVFLIGGGLLVVWPNYAVAVRRLHDRDKSGLWALVFVAPLSIMIFGFITGNGQPPSGGSILLSVLSMIVSARVTFELGFFKGTDGPNRFDADPLNAKKIEDDFAGSWADRPINEMTVAAAPLQVKRAVKPRAGRASEPQGFGRRGLQA